MFLLLWIKTKMTPFHQLNWYQRKLAVLVSAALLFLQLPEEASAVVCGDTAGFFGDPGSCTTFWVCSPDGATSFECNPGLIWNDGAKRCDWPYNTVCDKDPSKTTVKTTSSATTTATTTPSPSTSSSTETTTSTTTSVTTTSTTPPPTTTETTTTTSSPTTSSSSSTTSSTTTSTSSSSSFTTSSSSSSSSSTSSATTSTTSKRRTEPTRRTPRPTRPQTQQCKNRMDGFYPNWMKQCTEYFLCMGGNLTNRRKCSYGLVFDVFTAKCQRKENVKPPCGTFVGGSNGAFSFNSAPHWLLLLTSILVTSLRIF